MTDDPLDLYRGRLVEWIHTPRGGYGYTITVPAVVVSVGPKRVTIDAELATGGTRRICVRRKDLRHTAATRRAIAAARNMTKKAAAMTDDNRSPVSSHEWARVEDGISYAKQFELARAELAALRDTVDTQSASIVRLAEEARRYEDQCAALRERVKRLDAIVRQCFKYDHAIESVVSVDCPTVEEFRAALEEKP